MRRLGKSLDPSRPLASKTANASNVLSGGSSPLRNQASSLPDAGLVPLMSSPVYRTGRALVEQNRARGARHLAGMGPAAMRPARAAFGPDAGTSRGPLDAAKVPAVAERTVGMGSWAFALANQYGKLSPGELTYCSCIVLKLYRKTSGAACSDEEPVGFLLGHRGFEPNEFFEKSCKEELAGQGLLVDDVRAEIVAVGAASSTSFKVDVIKNGLDEDTLKYFGMDRHPIKHTDTLNGLAVSCSEIFKLSAVKIVEQADRGTGLVTTPTVIVQANNNVDFRMKGGDD
jgi:hypothetical protein